MLLLSTLVMVGVTLVMVGVTTLLCSKMFLLLLPSSPLVVSLLQPSKWVLSSSSSNSWVAKNVGIFVS